MDSEYLYVVGKRPAHDRPNNCVESGAISSTSQYSKAPIHLATSLSYSAARRCVNPPLRLFLSRAEYITRHKTVSNSPTGRAVCRGGIGDRSVPALVIKKTLPGTEDGGGAWWAALDGR